MNTYIKILSLTIPLFFSGCVTLTDNFKVVNPLNYQFPYDQHITTCPNGQCNDYENHFGYRIPGKS